MKNVTISLDDEVAAWLRIEAAKAGKSVSRFVGDHFAAQARPQAHRMEALERFLSGPGVAGIASGFSREALYSERADELFRGHEPAGVRARSGATAWCSARKA